MMTTIEIIKGYRDAYDDAVKQTRAHLVALIEEGQDESENFYFNQGILEAYKIVAGDFKDILATIYYEAHKEGTKG